MPNSGLCSSLSLFLLQDFQIQLFKKEITRSKAQSDVTEESCLGRGERVYEVGEGKVAREGGIKVNTKP